MHPFERNESAVAMPAQYHIRAGAGAGAGGGLAGWSEQVGRGNVLPSEATSAALYTSRGREGGGVWLAALLSGARSR